METLLSIEHELNPFPLYQEMRRSAPVFFDQERQNWNIFRFADVQRVLSEYDTFSSEFMQGREAGAEMPFAASMISSDPPRHRMLRGLVSQAFTPRAVEAIAPRISSLVNEMLDPAVREGRLDVIEDLATPLPVIVIAEMLGVPAEDRQQFKRWSDAVVELADFSNDLDPQRFMIPEMMEMGMYFMNMIEQRRTSPGDDLISGLLAAELEGQRLNEIELLGFCALLLVAGNETTTNLIGNAMLTFADHPEAWRSLREETDRLPQAIEEVLRYRSPVQSMFRVAKREVDLAGVTVPAGAPMVAWIGSANHDETQFPEPESFIPDRAPNRHLAFGQGIHYCLGAPLARLEAKIALTGMLERFEAFEITNREALERLPSLLVYGVKSLPIVVKG